MTPIACAEPKEVVIVFGAVVRADGTPGGALKRRVEAAIALASQLEHCTLIVSGGVHLAKVSEAAVMKTLLLAAGVTESRIIEDRRSADTLESAINCVELIRIWRNRPEVIVCSDGYHIPRCRWLLRLLGVSSVAAEVHGARAAIGFRKWLYWSLREIPATIADTFLLLGKKRY